MPLFKGQGCKSKPNKALSYITRGDKAAIISSQSMDDNRGYAEQFRDTGKLYGKGQGYNERKYYHFKLSCDQADNVTPEQSHKLAVDLAAELFPGHECVLATHNDTQTVHSHIIVNAINFTDGRKLHINDKEYRRMKDRANELAESYGLTPLDWRQATKDKRVRIANEQVNTPAVYTQAERYLQQDKGIDWSASSWKDALRRVVDEAKNQSTDRASFERYLKDNYGVEMPRNTSKSVSFIHPGVATKAVRGATLGADYTSVSIDRFLQQNRERILTDARLQFNQTNLGRTQPQSTDERTTGLFANGSTYGNRGYTQAGNGKRVVETGVDAVQRELRRIDENVKSITGTGRAEQESRQRAHDGDTGRITSQQRIVHTAIKRRAGDVEI